jgi:hypothetical protein
MIEGDSLVTFVEYAAPRVISHTLAQVQDRRCFEIPRREMTAPL